MWWENGFDPLAADGFVDALVTALEAHARFTGASRIALPRTAGHRSIGAAIRERLGRDGRDPVQTVTASRFQAPMLPARSRARMRYSYVRERGSVSVTLVAVRNPSNRHAPPTTRRCTS